ncbi:hypothetical protein B0T21DRAFT_367483 [Apiosordaria backusii]|uniref:Uncharacterized protein n=1 Tax=Apiosordaria backusii TaxID=314023 RepID=A0AA40BMA6_9PEZI|nr:hypothetical protein B0T21DRAFT_367483 [Apiosordaria backusii]
MAASRRHPVLPFTSEILPANIYSRSNNPSIATNIDQQQPPHGNRNDDGDESPHQHPHLSILEDQFPASYRRGDELEAPQGIPPLARIEEELNPTRLHSVINYLWLVGRPVPPRPLHYQIMLGREIVISEPIDMHLVWGYGKIYIKPIPRYLLNPRFWSEVLVCRCRPSSTVSGKAGEETRAEVQSQGAGGEGKCTCHAQRARQCALGLLLQYAALIVHESDFVIALEKKLIPWMEWPRWRRLVEELVQSTDNDTSLMYSNVAERYIYGELRLNRLNLISFIKGGLLRGGHLAMWNSYGSLYRDNSNAIIGGTVYILLLLSAMQVGLSTTKLAEDTVFQEVSYGFTIFSIMVPLVAIGVSALFFGSLILVNLMRTRHFEAQRATRLGRTWRDTPTREMRESGRGFDKTNRAFSTTGAV